MARIDPVGWLDAAVRTSGVGLTQVGEEACVTFEVDGDTIRLKLGDEEVACTSLGDATARIRAYAEDSGAQRNAVGAIDGFAADLADQLDDGDPGDLEIVADRWGIELASELDGDPPKLLDEGDLTFALDPHGTWWRVWADDEGVWFEVA